VNKFVQFLNTELHNRGWSMRELGRRITFSAAQISNVINGQSQPDADFVIAVATGLHADPVDLLRLAGHLPPTTAQARTADPALDEIVDIYQHLPPYLQTTTLHMLRGLANAPPKIKPAAQRLSPDLSPNADNAPQIEARREDHISDTGGENIALETYSRFLDSYPVEEVERVSAYFIALLEEAIKTHTQHKSGE